MLRIPVLCLLLLALGSARAEVPEPVRLDTSTEVPYQVIMDGELSGVSVKVLECIFGRMQQPYRIQVTSFSRARQNVSRRLADGFFSSAPDSQVDGYAQLSAPLLIEKWYWYALDPHVLNRPVWDPQLRIGSVLGSNALTWLESRGISVTQRASRLKQLVELLHHERIDLLLADSSAMHSLVESDAKRRPLLQRFVRYSPMGVYFSRAFLDEHPDFLKAFNRQVENCAPDETPLSDEERNYLQQLVKQHLQRWAYHPDLLTALRSGAQLGNSEERIRELDRQWLRERILEEKPLIKRVQRTQSSRLLANISHQYQPLFNELFVSDRSGQLLAMSRVTSDYWQADEEHFSVAIELPPGQVHISSIEYDGSTQSFQSKASAPLHDPKSGELLGVISLGINIEVAFGTLLP